MISKISEEVDELYEMYLATPEGFRFAQSQIVFDVEFQAWAHKDKILAAKKKQLVKFFDPDYVFEGENDSLATDPTLQIP